MKKFTFSVAALVLISASVVASESTNTGFYVGAAVSSIQNEFAAKSHYYYYEEDSDMAKGDTDHVGAMLQLGYKFNPYIAVETRYWATGGRSWQDLENWSSDPDDSFETKFDAMGLYLKPMYPVANGFDVYGLLGFALMNYDLTYISNGEEYAHCNFSDTSFSYGVGASYAINDSLTLFADYVRLYDDKITVFSSSYSHDYADITTDTFNFGLAYKF